MSNDAGTACMTKTPADQPTVLSWSNFPRNTPIEQVLEVFSELFIHIFDELNRNCKEEIEAVRVQHPFKDLRYARPTLRLTFQEGIQLLRDAGYDGKMCEVFVFCCSVDTRISRKNIQRRGKDLFDSHWCKSISTAPQGSDIASSDVLLQQALEKHPALSVLAELAHLSTHAGDLHSCARL